MSTPPEDTAKKAKPRTSTKGAPKRTHGRQENGAGSRIFKLPSGLLRIDVSLGFREDGKRDRRAVYGKTEEEVRQKANALQFKNGVGLILEANELTVGSLLDLWLESQKPYLEESSVERYEYELRHVPERIKKMRVQAVKLADFKPLEASLVAKRIGLGTRRKIFQHLRSAFREAMAQEVIVFNPVDAIRVRTTAFDNARKQDPVKKALTMEEMDAFLIAAEPNVYFPIFYTMFSLGVRVGEALGLRWEDIDFQKRSISLAQQSKIVRNKVKTGGLKTSFSQRSIPMSDDLAAVLETRRWAQDAQRDLLGAGWTQNGLVFTTGIGTALDRHAINKQIRLICKESGIRHFSSHACRHTNITALLRDGEKPDVVAKMAGHSGSAITTSIYRTVFEEEKPTFSISARREKLKKP
jgi:integrase